MGSSNRDGRDSNRRSRHLDAVLSDLSAVLDSIPRFVGHWSICLVQYIPIGGFGDGWFVSSDEEGIFGG